MQDDGKFSARAGTCIGEYGEVAAVTPGIEECKESFPLKHKYPVATMPNGSLCCLKMVGCQFISDPSF